MSKTKDKLMTLFKALISILPLGAQTIPAVGFMGPMVLPLLVYLLAIPGAPLSENPQLIWQDFLGIWSIQNGSLLGGIIFYIGLTVFCLSLSQWVWYHKKNLGLFKRGLYSKTRHPQFLGILTMTFGLTVKELTASSTWGLIGVPFLLNVHLGLLELVMLWFLQVLGYIAIAVMEDWSLTRKYGDEYRNYKTDVPLLFPITGSKKWSNILFTILLVIASSAILLVLPYDTIRILGLRYVPAIPYGELIGIILVVSIVAILLVIEAKKMRACS